MLKFDKATERLLDNAYQGAEITRRRQASFDALAPCPGETIMDIGCGNGLLTAELARAVGPQGRVIGVDASQDMLAAARARCAGFDWVDLAEGFADSLPVADATADKAVSVQVFEYIDNVDTALAEALRCLKPGGRLVISDIHFGTLVWFSQNRDRMDRMIAAWDGHCASGTLPERLPGLLRGMGQRIERVVAVTMTDDVLKPDGIAIMMMHLMRQYAIRKKLVAEDVAQAWFDEQLQLARDGRFFFSVSQFVVVARKA